MITKSKINYVVGDATSPIQTKQKKKIIVHVCNDVGKWGKGFVLALSKKWSQPEESYRNMPKNLMVLGTVLMVPVENDIIVANMIAQRGIKNAENPVLNNNVQPPIRYHALRDCLNTVNQLATKIDATIHMPRIGCGLAGGDWNEVEKIINETITVDTYVYDLPYNNIHSN